MDAAAADRRTAHSRRPLKPTRIRPRSSARVSLADAEGRPRLILKVEPDGNASIEFLDASGKVVQRVAPER